MALKDLVIRGKPAPKPTSLGPLKEEGPIETDDKHTWLYANRKYVTVVREVYKNGKFVLTEAIQIKWVHINTALALKPGRKQ